MSLKLTLNTTKKGARKSRWLMKNSPILTYIWQTARTVARKKAVQLELRYYLDLLDGWNGGDLYTVTQQRHQSWMVTAGSASRLKYQPGCLGAPPMDATAR